MGRDELGEGGAPQLRPPPPQTTGRPRYGDRFRPAAPAEDLTQLDDPTAWRCSRATAARVAACYDLLTSSPRTVTSLTGRGRVAPAAPTPPHVESDPHTALDRKQTSGAWTTGSSSATTAGRSGC